MTGNFAIKFVYSWVPDRRGFEYIDGLEMSKNVIVEDTFKHFKKLTKIKIAIWRNKVMFLMMMLIAGQSQFSKHHLGWVITL